MRDIERIRADGIYDRMTQIYKYNKTLQEKCFNLFKRLHYALGKINGSEWVTEFLLLKGVGYNAAICMPLHEDPRRAVKLRRRLNSLKEARKGRFLRGTRAQRKEMLLKRFDEILKCYPDFHELKTLRSLVKQSK